MTELSKGVQELLREPNFGHLATVMPDGSPQVTTVWVDTDGQNVLVNTAAGRRKTENVTRDPRVSLSIADQSNPYRSAMIRGRVVDVTTDGADAHIDALAKKYLGQETYPFRSPSEQRQILKIAPERVSSMGLD